ncbi:hypothetical protein DRN93_01220 [archaeon]|nr:MAG: hypothetical protein DRN93_01220 [archaeon]
MALYLVRKSDGYIYPYTETLARRADKFEPIELKRLPKNNKINLEAYYRKIAMEEARKAKEAEKLLKEQTKKEDDEE